MTPTKPKDIEREQSLRAEIIALLTEQGYIGMGRTEKEIIARADAIWQWVKTGKTSQ